MMHGSVSDPSFCAFVHRVTFEEVSGHQVLLKSGPGNRGLSACDTPTSLRLEFPRETGLILRCAGNVGNPFQAKLGNRPSNRKQEGRRCSDEVVQETWCSCRVRLACLGTFGVASMVQSTVLHFKTERGSFLEMP